MQQELIPSSNSPPSSLINLEGIFRILHQNSDITAHATLCSRLSSRGSSLVQTSYDGVQHYICTATAARRKAMAHWGNRKTLACM